MATKCLRLFVFTTLLTTFSYCFIINSKEQTLIDNKIILVDSLYLFHTSW